jgi:acyl CoA:acetate/3-ketoacid CoA transferase
MTFTGRSRLRGRTLPGGENLVDPREWEGDDERTKRISSKRFSYNQSTLFTTFSIDEVIIRGTTADEQGNISMEHEGSYSATRSQLAARNCGARSSLRSSGSRAEGV